MTGIIIGLIAFVISLQILKKTGSNVKSYPILILILLCTISGLRHDVGVDYPVYRDIYNYPSDIRGLALEPVWNYISSILRNFGFASRMWFIITSFAINILIYIGIKKMSVDPFLSLIVYIATSFGYVETFNIVRQYVAIGILFASFPYVMENKTYKYLICIGIASCFHISAIIMIPFLILIKTRFPSWLLWIGLCITFLFGNNLLSIVLELIIPQITEYSHYATNVNMEDYSGLLKLFYFLIGCGILIVTPLLKRYYKYANLFINATLISLMWYFVFLDVQVLMRCMFYLSIFFIILIPLVVNVTTKESRLILAPLIVIAFLTITLKMQWSIPYQWDFLLFKSLS